MSFYPTDRLALFIDGANLYSAAKGLGFDIDYRKLLEEFRKRGVLIRAYYYTALVEQLAVVDVEAQALGGRVEVGAVDEQRQTVGGVK